MAQPEKENPIPWGDPVDGLACRLLMQPRYVLGQAITATIEVKNVSDKKRWYVPRFYPSAVKYVTFDLTGPEGKVRQTSIENDSGTWLSESAFLPIGPGEVQRFPTNDLRECFASLLDWKCYPERKVCAVPLGAYKVELRFRSPKLPAQFITAKSFINGKEITHTKEVPAEVRAGEWAKEITAKPVSFELAPLGKDDLVVHEWGVFTVFNDAKYANLNRKEEWGSLPAFFYRQFPQERLRWMPAAWDKPIVYFYAKQSPMRVNVKVKFSEGAPVVWWPCASDPIEDRPNGLGPPKRTQPFFALTWEGWLGDHVPSMRSIRGEGPLVKVDDFPLPEGSWLQQARLPAASRITVIGNMEKAGRRFPGALDRYETERFIYYDGLVPAPDYVRCDKIENQSTVTLRNTGKFDMDNLFVVDRRPKDGIGFGKFNIQAGKSSKFELKSVEVKEWPAAGIKQVRAALLQAGLFEPEADSLLRIWQKQLFEADGITVFHILPVHEYDRMLPLDVLPAPTTRPVRVGIALHPHMEIEPDLTARVGKLLRQLDDDNFQKRDAATKELLEIGPLAIGHLRAELQKSPPAETASRIQNVLGRFDAAEWLKMPATKKPGS